MTALPIHRYYYHHNKERLNLQLHGFCDSSQVAFAGVVYIRATYTDTSVSTTLVIAKSKVAPLKTQTIPKLELCSAVLLSKLLSTVSRELNIDMKDVFAWSDSTIALGWINTSPHRLKTYVANRVVSIVDRIPANHWRHVSSPDNPADLGSRGTTAGVLVKSQLWWSGPSWLSQPPDYWPVQKLQIHTTSLPDVKSTALTIETHQPNEDITSRFSSFSRLIRVVSWMYRFINNARSKLPDRVFSSQLSVQELQASETVIFKLHQQHFMSKELAALKTKMAVSVSSPLHSLHPILDCHGVLRVGGRLSQSGLSYSQCHPVILHKKAHLSKLIVHHLHIVHFHAGPTLLMGLLAQCYYMIGARRLVRNISRNCVVCQKTYARTSSQIMGELPSARIMPAPPFSKTGVDFAGPVTLKRGHTRKPSYVKAYISLFICLATKAVHLELVSSLSTADFLAAFRRFVARRGCPVEVLSDNGTNFVGANRELQELYQHLDSQESKQEICEYFTSNRITWKFSPGRAPHFGGLWEAAVKSTKSLLKKLLGSQSLTVEEYWSVLVDVESILNSRPLCPLNTLPEDGLEVLTPGHFLVGRPLTALPQLSLKDLPMSSVKRWNLCQKVSAEFWQRWSREYLQILQKRHKWKSTHRNFRVGDIVLVKDQVLFTHSWPLALVTKLHPGSDGCVRTVTIRTSKGIYTRPIVKLVLLVPQGENKDLPPQSKEEGECSGH